MSDTSGGQLAVTAPPSGLPPLCTPADIITRMMGTITEAQLPAVPAFLADASALIRRWTGQLFTQMQTTDVLLLRADGACSLPQRPVQSVDDVSVINPDDSVTPVVGWWWDGTDLLRTTWDAGWVINAPAIWYDQQPDTIQVTYTHGYATVPDEVAGVCAAATIRRLTEPAAHLRTMRVGSYEEMYYDAQSPGSVYLTADDMLTLADYRHATNSMRLT